jgi:hypothetical protein
MLIKNPKDRLMKIDPKIKHLQKMKKRNEFSKRTKKITGFLKSSP